ncbi:pyoverdine biosynthesis protein [Fischerella thermalis CCMEE 5201]|jgi:pyoverdine/dityrosine biosynthesis protein Dit1|nr:pyoverdine biosynthesis protein [Fischerella thermalis CCMEE 5201]
MKSTTLAKEILNLLLPHRRLLPSDEMSPTDSCSPWLINHIQKTMFFIEQEKPIHFVLPAFPAKSPNPEKVLGFLPDMGEKISLKFLQSLCEQIREIYAPGVQITICSDGRVFSDLVCVEDENVTAYGREIQEIIHEIGADSIDIFNLEDVFRNMNFDQMRQEAIQRYGESLESLRSNVKNDHIARQLFNGIHRFLVEDYLVLYPSKSRNKVKNECKDLAYQVIQRSNAWGNLVAEQFPYALRFSIHPQPYHSEKIGIHMIKTSDQWGTPWHNATVFDGKEYRLMKRSQIESMGALLVYEKGRPSHYVLSRPLQVSDIYSLQEAA